MLAPNAIGHYCFNPSVCCIWCSCIIACLCGKLYYAVFIVGLWSNISLSKTFHYCLICKSFLHFVNCNQFKYSK